MKQNGRATKKKHNQTGAKIVHNFLELKLCKCNEHGWPATIPMKTETLKLKAPCKQIAHMNPFSLFIFELPIFLLQLSSIDIS